MGAAQQYCKFEYKEFGAAAGNHVVVLSPATTVQNPVEREQDRLIDEVIADHFAENISSVPPHEEVFKQPLEPTIDVEAIKIERYNKGYNEAKAFFEPQLQQIKSDAAFETLLKEKLESIAPAMDLEAQIFKLVANLLGVIAKKLHLMLPADFEAIILGEMVPLLSKYYKIGAITLNVKPDRVAYCQDLFRIGSLPHHIAENIIVTADESIAKDSCSIGWNDTLLEYNQEELVLDAENILEHLKIKVSN